MSATYLVESLLSWWMPKPNGAVTPSGSKWATLAGESFLSFSAATRQFALQRRQAELLQARFVHVAGVEVADLLGVRARFAFGPGGDFLDDAAHLRLGSSQRRLLNAPQLDLSDGMSTVFSHLPFR
jgi:hypothetical protein